MNTALRYSIAILAFTSLLSFTQFTQASVGEWIYESNKSMEAFIAGLEEKTVEVDGEEWVYYQKNETTDSSKNKSCTVLIHGFTAEASHWFRFARNLDQDNCIIVPDLPGFGRSDFSEDGDYSIPAQANRLEAFLKQLNISDTYHFAGSSMGGHIIATYAIKFPKQVASLTLIDAAGVAAPEPSTVDIQIKKTGRTAFDVSTEEEFSAMLALSMSNPPWIPSIVKSHVAEQAISRTPRNMVIYSQVYRLDAIDTQLAEITSPTLIIWGDEDNLLHPSMADVYHKGIKGSELVTLPNIGHLPFMETPSDTAKLFNDFLSTQEK